MLVISRNRGMFFRSSIYYIIFNVIHFILPFHKNNFFENSYGALEYAPKYSIGAGQICSSRVSPKGPFKIQFRRIDLGWMGWIFGQRFTASPQKWPQCGMSPRKMTRTSVIDIFQGGSHGKVVIQKCRPKYCILCIFCRFMHIFLIFCIFRTIPDDISINFWLSILISRSNHWSFNRFLSFSVAEIGTSCWGLCLIKKWRDS